MEATNSTIVYQHVEEAPYFVANVIGWLFPAMFTFKYLIDLRMRPEINGGYKISFGSTLLDVLASLVSFIYWLYQLLYGKNYKFGRFFCRLLSEHFHATLLVHAFNIIIINLQQYECFMNWGCFKALSPMLLSVIKWTVAEAIGAKSWWIMDIAKKNNTVNGVIVENTYCSVEVDSLFSTLIYDIIGTSAAILSLITLLKIAFSKSQPFSASDASNYRRKWKHVAVLTAFFLLNSTITFMVIVQTHTSPLPDEMHYITGALLFIGINLTNIYQVTLLRHWRAFFPVFLQSNIGAAARYNVPAETVNLRTETTRL